MKPHEEDWIPVGCEVYLTKPADEPIAQFFDDNEGTSLQGRAKLAAQAPAMARLLLQWMDYAATGYHAEAEKILRDAGVIA